MLETIELFEIPDELISLTKDNIYTTTASRFEEFYSLYKQSPLPDDVLFPWLHGVDGYSNQQNLFFGVRNCVVPKYRGLMLVHCYDLENTARLIDSVLPDQIVSKTHPSEFIDTYNKDISINLRNFSNQIARFSTLCDLILYGPTATEVAEILSSAQKKLFEQRAAQLENMQQATRKRLNDHVNTINYKIIIVEGKSRREKRVYVLY
jgi:hypothetical protein